MGRPRIRRVCLLVLCMLVAAGIAAVTARADAPSVKVSTPAPGQHPLTTGTATVDTATGHVTVTLIGGWSWPTHGKDCNTDRAGAGVGVNWFDPLDRGFHVGFFDANGGVVDKTPGGPDDFGVGATGADGLNPVDDVVHPTENDTGTGAVVDITNPSEFANWRGGCGVFSSDTVLKNDKGTLSYETTTVSHGNFGKATPASTDASGVPFNNPTPPSDPSLQGALLKHVYASKSDVTQVCALMYDVHPGTTAAADNGVGIPGSAKEVTAGQQAVAAGAKYSGDYNGDNSIQDNANTAAGNSCPTFSFPSAQVQIVKTADAAQVNAGEQIGFTLTVFNSGGGDAQGVKLSDTLPTKSGLSWTIASQGAGWGGTCSISAGVLSCGGAAGVTVPAGTTQAASTFTVHITSPTTAASGGGCPGGSGVVDNTGTVTTTNGGSGQSSASTCVAAPSIQIVKSADAPQVNAGQPIGFTLTVFNTGSGDATGVTLSDTLPAKAGLSWTIASQGAGWVGSCAIAGGVLSCGPVTVPAGTTQAASTFTVHITSPTTSASGGGCPGGSGVVDNTGTVTATNGGSGQSTASTCVAGPAIEIVKTPDAAQVSAGQPIGFTLTVFNTGSGNATGVTLSDTLPTNAGLSWTIASQGAGWAGTCAIAGGVLSCGPVTVPAATTQAASTFTVHVTSPTTAATGGSCPGGSGSVDNTGTVTTTNDGSSSSTATTCVAAPGVQIVKTPDQAEVNEGQQIGFTLTVFNPGSGDAFGVKLDDQLPANAGLSWTVASQGAGWGGTCSISAGVLSCGGAAGVTVPAGTTQAASTFTVHITSPTTAATGGDCPGGSGTVDNTGTVTATNGGSGQSSASTCVQALVDLSITKTGSPSPDTLPGNITWTMVVTNNGPDADTGVTITDPMPAGNTFVSASTTQGTCTGGATLTCDIGPMASGATVTITLVTTPSQPGTVTNTVTVVGNRPETNTSNNTATASVQVVSNITPPPVFCVAVSKVTPKQLFVGRKTTLTIHVSKHGKAVKGVRVSIKGPRLNLRTTPSNSKGVIKHTVKLKKAGVLVFSPIASKRCNTKRVGVTGVFTPPVTG